MEFDGLLCHVLIRCGNVRDGISKSHSFAIKPVKMTFAQHPLNSDLLMEYEIKLSGTPFDDGAIDLDRLEIIAQYLHNIAKGSLQMRMFGSSYKRGRETEQIAHALRIRLRGLSKGSTVLHLECQPFRETLRSVQGNLFHQEILRRLPEQTPMSLVMESFQDALNPQSDSEMLDKYLLKDLQNFKKVLANEAQVVQFSNRGSLPDLQLKMQDFQRLKTVEEQTPNPQPVMISGIVEELKFSKAKVIFLPDQGRAITGYLGETIPSGEIAKYWGQKVTIRGTAHFRPSGQMAFVEIGKVALAEPGDTYFSRPVLRETVAQQLERQIAAKKTAGNKLGDFIGIFSDAEGSYESDLKMLAE
jgi:hypothetical protein